jgi:hypothetical protein
VQGGVDNDQADRGGQTQSPLAHLVSFLGGRFLPLAKLPLNLFHGIRSDQLILFLKRTDGLAR